jgi:uncharacterized protein
MKVRWEDIPQEGKEIALDEPSPFCLRGRDGEEDEETRVVSETEGMLFFRSAPKGMEVAGRFRTAVTLRCARCLKEFILFIESEFEESFIFREHAPRNEDQELLEEDMDVSFLPEEGLEPRDIIEEQIWLNIPMKPLCREGCKGLCSMCGADLNLGECGCTRRQDDSRFVVLHALKQKLPEGRG